MQLVGIKALKDNLSAYIRAAAAGETVLVTDRGQVVAEIVAARATAGATSDVQRMALLAGQGVATLARRRLTGPPPHVPTASHDELMRELETDREDR